MVDLARKLNLKAGYQVCLLGVPEGVELMLPDGAEHCDDPAIADAVIVFVRDHAGLDNDARPAIEAARRDAVWSGLRFRPS